MEDCSMQLNLSEPFATGDLEDSIPGPDVQQWLGHERPFHNNLPPLGFNPSEPVYSLGLHPNTSDWHHNGMPSDCDTDPVDSGYGSVIQSSSEPMELATPHRTPYLNLSNEVGDQLAGFHLGGSGSERHLMQNQNGQVGQSQCSYSPLPQQYQQYQHQDQFQYQQQPQQQPQYQHRIQHWPQIQQHQPHESRKQDQTFSSMGDTEFWCHSCNKAVKTKSELKSPDQTTSHTGQIDSSHWEHDRDSVDGLSDDALARSHAGAQFTDPSKIILTTESSNPEPSMADKAFDSLERQWEHESAPSFELDTEEPQISPVGQQLKQDTEISLDSDEWSDEQKIEMLSRWPKSVLRKALAATSGDNTGRGSLTGTHGIKHKCDECPKKFKRPCELMKHMKRHDRPYACTVCSKRFGSKNDWKRHEGTQHEIKELWHCDLGCHKVFTHREAFETHLHATHKDLEEASVEAKLANNRTGLHGKPSFWCGFCGKLLTVAPGKKSDVERADHIDNHFMGRDSYELKIIEEWKQMEDCYDYVLDVGFKRKRNDVDAPECSRPAKQRNNNRRT
ncbi:Zinc finger X-linked protein-like protein [Emericellopsis cladophorae]|uniref:Zinc finger X-linked protein-like protein n=1 Tax=Emericellopsis cladophorae TaxID=2686198 RepID=A0A9P9Y1Z5_9HYPO|nr:Zinc finger X-linked protein-like protein [Emericellopsis cladophorae]KAI6781668.1 Zinc finger X-linked protein-like protein [Emericellopsis cladophorae]